MSLLQGAITTTQEVQIWVGMLAGLLGLSLGVLNWIQRRSDTRPQIRLRPVVRTIVSSVKDEPNETVALMEIANIGRVAIHGSVIGFTGGGKGDPFVKHPSPIDGTRWPRAVEPGTSCHLRFDLDSAVQVLKDTRLNRAWMSTQTGEIYHSSKKDMLEFRDAVAKATTATPSRS